MKHVVGVAFWLIAAVVQCAAGDVIVMGIGAQPCTQWNSTRDTERNSKLSAVGEYFKGNTVAWAMGFLSSEAISTGDNLLKGTTPDAIANALDKYCQLRPTQPTFEAVKSIAKDLRN